MREDLREMVVFEWRENIKTLNTWRIEIDVLRSWNAECMLIRAQVQHKACLVLLAQNGDIFLKHKGD